MTVVVSLVFAVAASALVEVLGRVEEVVDKTVGAEAEEIGGGVTGCTIGRLLLDVESLVLYFLI